MIKQLVICRPYDAKIEKGKCVERDTKAGDKWLSCPALSDPAFQSLRPSRPRTRVQYYNW